MLYEDNCYGPSEDPCFETSDGWVMDKLDRVAISYPAAIEECKRSGGVVPDQREFSELMHREAPDGSNQWLWLSDGVYWHSNNYGTFRTRWNGTGTTTWEFGDDNMYTAGSTYSYFRCVYSPNLR